MNFRIISALLLVVCAMSRAELIPSDPIGLPVGVKNAITLWDKLSEKQISNWVTSSVPTIGSGFTVGDASGSSQGKERALLFGKSGETIYGVGPEHGHIEMVSDVNGETIPYILDPREGEREILGPLFQTCAGCHNPYFTYIFPEYRESKDPIWKGFLGETEDRVDPRSSQFRALKRHPNFAPLFLKPPRESYPYWQMASAEEVKAGKAKDFEKIAFSNMPNSRLSIILAQRAARRLVRSVSVRKPARYQRYKLLLMKRLMDCPLSEKNNEFSSLENQFSSEEPRRAAKWVSLLEKIPKRHLVKTRKGSVTGGNSSQLLEADRKNWKFGLRRFYLELVLTSLPKPVYRPAVFSP